MPGVQEDLEAQLRAGCSAWAVLCRSWARRQGRQASRALGTRTRRDRGSARRLPVYRGSGVAFRAALADGPPRPGRAEGVVASLREALRPTLNPQALEPAEVDLVRGDEHQVIDACDRRDLTVDKRRRLSYGLESHSLAGMPFG